MVTGLNLAPQLMWAQRAKNTEKELWSHSCLVLSCVILEISWTIYLLSHANPAVFLRVVQSGHSVFDIVAGAINIERS